MRDYNEAHQPAGSPIGGQFAPKEGGALGSGESKSNYGLVPGDAEKFRAIKVQWAKVNNDLLNYVGKPDSPEAQSRMKEMERLCKEMQGLHADPGTPAGIGLPGGPRDVAIVGAGPGGLAAGIMGGAEGLDTLVLDQELVGGGQAKFSSRIENYPGFPIGVAGKTLTSNMLEQAQRIGAQTKLGTAVTGLGYDEKTGLKTLTMANGEKIDARTVILAGGVQFRQPDFKGADGPGVIVADPEALTSKAAGGTAVVLGGSNGASQAALGAATKADHVYLISRSPITKGMSDYQVAAIRNHPKITVLENETVAKLNRDETGNPKSIETNSGKTIPSNVVGVFLGSLPKTDWVGDKVARDRSGRVITNANLETNMPGVYAIGAMRVGAIGRIGVAVGEGQMSLRQANVYLDGLKKAAGVPVSKVGDASVEEDQTNHSDFITQLFALDYANPYLGSTIEGIKPGRQRRTRDGDDIMRDREFSAGSRETLAKSGRAMKSGGFPIVNESDLRNAIRAIGRAKNPGAARAHIKKRAAALGKSNLIPENWDSIDDGWRLLELDAVESRALMDAWGKKKPDDDEDDDDDDTADAKPKPGDDDEDEEDGDEDDDEDEEDLGDSRVVMHDTYLIDKVRSTKDGYLVCDARIARTGIQLYRGDEIGVPDMDVVRVYRPPDEVFNSTAMRSLAHRPITLNHPPVMVDASNWKEYAVGHTGDEVTRDGDCVRVPMVIMDSRAIAAYTKHGVRELSVGYSTDLKWGRGKTVDGDIYDAKQTAIRGNHLAVVPAARGGSRLRIGDDHLKGDHTMMVKILIDGQTVEFQDELAARHVQNHIIGLHNMAADLQTKLDKSKADKEKDDEQKTRQETDAAAKTGEIVALKKQLEDAKLTEDALDKMIEDRMDLRWKAHAAMDGKVDFSGKKPAEIRRTVVAAKMGDDVAKSLSDAEIVGAFKYAVTDIKPRTGVDRLTDNLSMLNIGGGNHNDPKAIRDAAYEEHVKSLSNAWRRNAK